MADLSDDIETSAAGPKKVATDGVSTEEHALKDLIEADRYLAAKAASRSNGRGLHLTKLNAPGTV